MSEIYRIYLYKVCCGAVEGRLCLYFCRKVEINRRYQTGTRARVMGFVSSLCLESYMEVTNKVICGAKTKSSGMPCRIRDIYKNGRCKYHGGLSAGPRTVAGKRRSALNGFKSISS